MPRSGAFWLGVKLSGLISAGDFGMKLVGLISTEALARSGEVGAVASPASGSAAAEAIGTPWSIEEAQEGFAGGAPVVAAVLQGPSSNGLLVAFWVRIGSQACSGAGAGLEAALGAALAAGLG